MKNDGNYSLKRIPTLFTIHYSLFTIKEWMLRCLLFLFFHFSILNSIFYILKVFTFFFSKKKRHCDHDLFRGKQSIFYKIATPCSRWLFYISSKALYSRLSTYRLFLLFSFNSTWQLLANVYKLDANISEC